ncbi:MAG TPA: YdbL family protein [Victivallales bacterium]|nr:YdbL family protein [Victivallales bacterium]
MKFKLFIFLTVLSTLFTINIKADSITTKMKARLPEIVKLKQQEIVGENNQGYLEFRKPDPEGKKLIDQENKDRKIIYKIIAKNQNTTVAKVGKLRAKQIADKSAKGYWLQNPAGKWYQK